jgi:predicted ribosomally synthesized peptide with nif11-like leader
MKFKGQEIPREVVEKAMQCDTPEELVALAKEHGFEITTKQAEAYLVELEDFDLDSEQMKKVAGGLLAFCQW